MARQQWKDIFEGIGFLAIIGSLIFVGIESRNSTRQAALTTQALEITAYQDLMTNIEELNLAALQNDNAASALERIWEEPDDSGLFGERRVLFLLFRHGDMAYFMYERGAISEDRLRSALRPLPLHIPFVREFWDQNKITFTKDYQSHIDNMIAGIADNNAQSAATFVDAFYSFDSGALQAVLSTARDSAPRILFYQGWAEGGNYEVIERMPCKVESEQSVSCSITVKDDLIGALGIGMNVTDTFHLTFAEGQIVSVTNSSNDPQAYYDAEEWVEENRPELIEEPCKGFFDGGLTPGDCVRAMVRGYSEFAASGQVSESPLTSE